MYEELYKSLSLKEKLGQMIMIGFKGHSLNDKTKYFIEKNNIGFIDIFSRNFSEISQILKLTNEIHSLAKIQPMIFTDQEGGIVCQFGEELATFVSPMGLAATNKTKNAFLAGKGIAKDLKKIGIDSTIAPVVDVVYESKNPIIGIRAFSDRPKIVSKYAEKFINGIKSEGIAPLLKHYPGHGGTTEDSHLTLPKVEKNYEFIKNNDLFPYYKLSSKVDFIMGAHVLFPQIENNPATFSSLFCSKILREEIGFRGVLITDCLEMASIKNNYSPEEIVKKSIQAGADVLLSSHNLKFQKEILNSLIRLVKSGEISEKRIKKSIIRILRAKEKYGILKNKRKKVSFSPVRQDIKVEEKIALESIVVLRDKNLPIPLDSNISIIEWEKPVSTVQLSETKLKSFLDETARSLFQQVHTFILPLKLYSPKEMKDIKSTLKNSKYILVGTYSRSPSVEKIQATWINQFLKIRKDIIVISMGNPYDIREFPEIENYITTFGFRKVQIKALFKVLTGEALPQRTLPVNLNSFLKIGKNGE